MPALHDLLTAEPYALMAAFIGAAVLTATFFAWLGKDTVRDVRLLGGVGAGLIALAGAIWAL